MQPHDLDLLVAAGRPSLAPDGATAVVPATRPDVERDAYTGQLWEVPVAGGAPRRLTRGFRDTAPVHSPDGRRVAFLRAERDGKPQLHVVRTSGGEPVRLTDLPLGVSGRPVWSPDGARLAFVARVPEQGRYGTDSDVGPAAEPPRRLTTLSNRVDGVGFFRDQPEHVHVVDLPDLDGDPVGLELPEARQLTTGELGRGDVAWSPDGALLACTGAAPSPDGREDLTQDVWVLPAEGGELRCLTAGHGLSASGAAFSRDGSAVVFLASEHGEDGLDFVARHTGLWRVPVDGTSAPTRLTPSDLDLGEVGSHVTVLDGGALVQARSRGAVHLLRVPFDGGEPQVLLEGHLQVRGHDATGDAAVVVATSAGTADTGELVVVDGTVARPLTTFSEPLRATGRLREPQELEVASSDGYPVHGWVVLPDPERFGEGPHPVLLDVHGGPFAQYGWSLFDEAQVYAGAGYAVLLPNPRGAAGYGEEHGRTIVGRFGTVDADDVMAFLDGALQRFPLAGDRVGVMGGSYGGYMTAWLLAQHPDRWAAGIVERGFLDPLSFQGSADIGWFFPSRYLGDDRAAVEAQSPMAVVDRVTAPTLVVHSEQDWRCPVEQAHRYFVALKQNGVETELLLFPGEGHELTRSGRPKHRQQRFEAVLGWWARHLPVG